MSKDLGTLQYIRQCFNCDSAYICAMYKAFIRINVQFIYFVLYLDSVAGIFDGFVFNHRFMELNESISSP